MVTVFLSINHNASINDTIGGSSNDSNGASLNFKKMALAIL